jgi:RNA polymerase sigma-70 factor (ECF subfamily)
MATPGGDVEEQVAKLCAASDYRAAATRVIQGYGPEIYRFIRVSLGSADDPDETFADFVEAVWTGLPGFRWTSKVRTWSYAIARNLLRARGRQRRRRQRIFAHAGESVVEKVAEQVRSETASFLRTEKRTRLSALRDALPEEDRMLLVLRVDRQLKWNELARVFLEAGNGEIPDGTTLVREAARLRKRLQLIKVRLKEMARSEGLLGK